MRFRNRLSKSVVITLSCLGMMIGQSAGFAANPSAAKSPAKSAKAKVNDVALGANGTMIGRIVDEQGYPLEGAKVTLHQGKKVVASAVTDKRGAYHVTGLRAGVYQVTAGNTTEVCRLWAENTAPPAAREGLLTVAGEQVVRGQGFGGGVSGEELLALGLGVAGLTVGTIALIKNNDTQDELDDLRASLLGIVP